jgi:hypothetical protein
MWNGDILLMYCETVKLGQNKEWCYSPIFVFNNIIKN